jgi:uncharacterized hydrophobic protein (TIGR00341 family)
LLEVVIPAENSAIVLDEVLADIAVSQRWEQKLEEGLVLVKLIANSVDAEHVVDQLEDRFSSVDAFRVLVLPLEAVIPRLSPDAEAGAEIEEKSQNERISREELYTDISQSAKLSRVFLAQVALSTIVAAIGLIRNDVAVIIGAMVIAPLLGPNVALALATTLGDLQLAVNSLKTNIVGVSIALILSIIIGYVLKVDQSSAAIVARTHVDVGDVALALASGVAGVLAFTSGAPSSLVGVMVAVALLPPLVVFGLLAAAGNYSEARGAFFLVATNLICVNLAGVFTFFVQGVRPRTWWAAKRAKTATRISLAIWTLLLILLIVLISVAGAGKK